ncbi:hypothetical protein HZA38_02875 [Candidatus Peregrinibacteria bacterium]|nr:hypothetical protein [Candidatus Peregrinibacteria bacterium]
MLERPREGEAPIGINSEITRRESLRLGGLFTAAIIALRAGVIGIDDVFGAEDKQSEALQVPEKKEVMRKIADFCMKYFDFYAKTFPHESQGNDKRIMSLQALRSGFESSHFLLAVGGERHPNESDSLVAQQVPMLYQHNKEIFFIGDHHPGDTAYELLRAGCPLTTKLIVEECTTDNQGQALPTGKTREVTLVDVISTSVFDDSKNGTSGIRFSINGRTGDREIQDSSWIVLLRQILRASKTEPSQLIDSAGKPVEESRLLLRCAEDFVKTSEMLSQEKIPGFENNLLELAGRAGYTDGAIDSFFHNMHALTTSKKIRDKMIEIALSTIESAMPTFPQEINTICKRWNENQMKLPGDEDPENWKDVSVLAKRINFVAHALLPLTAYSADELYNSSDSARNEKVKKIISDSTTVLLKDVDTFLKMQEVSPEERGASDFIAALSHAIDTLRYLPEPPK